MTDEDLDDDPPTVVPPCPAFERLDALMSIEGKSTKDGWTPAAFYDWWGPWNGAA